MRADEQGQIVLESVPSDPIQRFIEAGREAYKGVEVDAYVRELREGWDR